MPPQIDKTFLAGSNQSRTQTMNALKALELIEDDGSLTEDLIALVKAGKGRPAAVARVLERFYPEPVRLGTVNATQQQLDKALEDYGVSGSTTRKAVSFYLKAADYANVPVSPHFKTPSKSTPRKRRTKKAPRRPTGTARTNGTNLTDLRLQYIEMLMNRAKEDFDAELLDRIEGLLDFPQQDEPEATDEDDEDED
jgi:hypothetical protein